MSTEIAETKETEIVLPPASAEVQTLNALTQSIATGQLQPEQLSMVLDAQERILDRQIKQAFMADMALCQADMPAVIKHGWNKHTESAYEKIDDLNNAIKPTYTKYGFAVSFNSTPSFQEGWIGMKATVSHRLGWSEEHTYELPPDIAGIGGKVNKTVIHGTSSSRLYMRRYLLKEIFNITTSDDVDDDGNAAEPIETLTKEEVANIESLITELGIEKAAFLKIAKKDSIEEIHRDRYKSAVHALEAKRKA